MVDQYGRWYPDYPGQQPYQDPAYMQRIGLQTPGNQNAQMVNANQQDLLPTIRTEIKQVENVDAISKTAPAPGTTGVYMTKDEKMIIFRSMYANGEYTDRIYDERPPEPPAPKFDPSEYVRKDEMDRLVKEALAAYIAEAKKEKTSREDK